MKIPEMPHSGGDPKARSSALPAAAQPAPVAPKDTVEVTGKSDKGGLLNGVKQWAKQNISGDGTAQAASRGQNSDFGDNTALIAGAGAALGAAGGAVVGGLAGFKEQQADQVVKTLRSKDITDPKLTGYTRTVTEDGHYEEYQSGYEPGHYETVTTGTDKKGNPTTEQRFVEGHPVYSDRWVVDGYWQRYYPDINDKKVGTYTVPEYQHSSGWTALTGALAGLAAGAALGGATGLIVGVVNKALHQSS